MYTKSFYIFFVLMGLIVFPQQLLAVDTTESFEVGGLTDLEVYFSTTGIGSNEKQLGFDFLFGGGINERLSYFLLLSQVSDTNFAGGLDVVQTGFFYNLLAGRIFDFDVFLAATSSDPGLQVFSLTPGFEWNLDFAAPYAVSLGKFGFFGTAQLELSGSEKESDTAIPDDNLPQTERNIASAFSFGAYYSLTEEVQLLSAIDSAYHHNNHKDERNFATGALTLGLNVVLSDKAELITELSYDIPENDEEGVYGAVIGTIFTL